MSAKPLTEYLDPFTLSERSSVMQGRFSLATMSRLTGSLLDSDGEVEAELRFRRDAGRRYVVEGHASTEVTLSCERCLQPVRQALTAGFKLAVVRDEAEAERLPEEYDPLIHEGPLRTADLIEDELILALPIVAVHGEDTECATNFKARTASPAGDESEASQRRKNPFAVLADLKKTDH